MKITVRVTVFILLMSALTFSQNSVPHERNGIQKRFEERVKNIEYKQQALTHIISELAIENRIPIGIEMPPSYLQQNVNFSFKGGTMKNLLDSVVLLLPDYDWEIIDDVVNFKPKTPRDSILNVVVEQYDTTERGELELRESITELPELQRKMEELGVEPFHISNGSLNGSIMPNGFSLKLRSVTARTILNEIAKRSSNKYWILSYGGNKRELLFLYL